MAQKDLSLKALFRHNDVYADVINALVFDGKSFLRAEDLEMVDTDTQYAGENRKLHEQRRDLSRNWKEKGIIRVRLSIENQTKDLWYMPARLIGYDGVSYAEQFTKEEMKKNQAGIKRPGYISVTLVLYYGLKPWKHSRNLNDVMHAHEKFRKLAPDYHMNLYEIAFLSKEELEKFHSDFRVLADYLIQMRTTGKYE